MRALRRAQWARVKRRVKEWMTDWGRHQEWPSCPLGRVASHHHTCWMCGNPRRYFRQRTYKEQLADLAFREWQDGQRW